MYVKVAMQVQQRQLKTNMCAGRGSTHKIAKLDCLDDNELAYAIRTYPDLYNTIVTLFRAQVSAPLPHTATTCREEARFSLTSI
jgi:hypothetical protein